MFNQIDPKEVETITIKGLLAAAGKGVIQLTVDQYQRAIDNSIAAGANKTDLVVTLLQADPYIGFTDKGDVLIFAGKVLPTELWTQNTWINTLTVGTFNGTKIVAVALDTTVPIAIANRDMITSFMTITFGDITDIDWTQFAHGLSVENTGYIFCVDTLVQLELVGTHASFSFIKSSEEDRFEVIMGKKTLTGVVTLAERNIVNVRLDKTSPAN